MNFTRTGSFQFKRHQDPTRDDNYLTEFTNMASAEPMQIPAEQDLAKSNNDKPVTPSRIHVKTNRHRDKSPISKEDLLLKHKYSGKIKYVNLDASEYSSKFVVVDKETETAETLVKKIFNDCSKGWFKHQMPKLIISVTGSAQNFQMKPNLKSVFRRGIAQAAKSTSAWILTGGTYSGVMKHVGDAMHEYSSWNENDNNMYSELQDDVDMTDVPIIGFATFHTLAKGIQVPIENSVTNSASKEVLIPAEGHNPNLREVFLDRNHTHFVLVSSKQNRETLEQNEEAAKNPNTKLKNPKFGEEIDLWASTEKYIIDNWNTLQKQHKKSEITSLDQVNISRLVKYTRKNIGILRKSLKKFKIVSEGADPQVFRKKSRRIHITSKQEVNHSETEELLNRLCSAEEITVDHVQMDIHKARDEILKTIQTYLGQITPSIHSSRIKKDVLKTEPDEDEETGDKSIPALLISIQGGPGTLKTCTEHLKEDIPLVAIRSSGGWTDVICDFCKTDSFSTENVNKLKFESYKDSGENPLQNIEYISSLSNPDEDKTIFTDNTDNSKSKIYTGNDARLAVLIVQKLQDYKLNVRGGKFIPINTLHIDQCIRIEKYKSLITVFDLMQNQDELDTAMMRAVLSAQAEKANKGNSKMTKILLAMQYNKADLIREELFQDDSVPLDQTSMGLIFDEAIRFKKHEFIDMLLDMDFDFKNHLTPKKLLEYYNGLKPKDNTVLYNTFLPSYKHHMNTCYNYEKFTDLKTHINEIETDIFGPEYEPSFNDYSETISQDLRMSTSFSTPVKSPLKEMLFWSTMSGDFSLTQVFYNHLARYEGGGILSALAVSHIFREAQHRTKSIEFASELKIYSCDYEKIAVEILSKAYRKARVQAAILVGIPKETWGNLTPLKMAMSRRGRDFVSQQGFQEWLDIIWYYRVEPFIGMAGAVKFFLFVLFGWVPGVLSLCRFRNLPLVLQEHNSNVYLEKRNVPESQWARSNRTIDGSIPDEEYDSSSQLTENQKNSYASIFGELDKKIWRKSCTELNWWQKIVEFYHAPVVTFSLNGASMLILLVIYGYFLMLDVCYKPTVFEYIVSVWMISTFMDEFRQYWRSGNSFASRNINYLSDMWNYLDIGIIFCYTNACIFRIAAAFVDPAFKNWMNDPNWSNRGYSIYQTCDPNSGLAPTDNGPVSCDFNNYCPLLMGKDDGTDLLFTALIFHCITFVLLCFKFANSLSISRSMGPLIIIIIKMMQDMIRFLLLLAVMIVAFGVTSNALLYPNHWDGWRSLYSAMYRAYYAIYGELQTDEHSYDKFQAKSVKFELLKVNDTQYNWATHLDEVYLERGCYTVFTKPSDIGKNLSTYEQTDYEAILRCPQGRGFADIFLGIYMLFTNVLLLNLLIALFTTTYEIAMRNADQIWKFQRTGLVKEYRDRPTLPPPLILIPYFVFALRKVYLFCTSCCRKAQVDHEGQHQTQENLKKFSKRYTSEIIFNISDKFRRNLARLERVSADDAWADRERMKSGVNVEKPGT